MFGWIVGVVADTVVGEIAKDCGGVFEGGANAKGEGGIGGGGRWEKAENGKRGNASSDGGDFTDEGDGAEEFVFHKKKC